MKEMPDSHPTAIGWNDISNIIEIELKKDKNEFIFRTVNLAGVTGPEHKIIIER